MAVNPILDFAKTKGALPASSSGIPTATDNPILKHAGKGGTIPSQGASSTAMKTLLGADAVHMPQTADDARKLQETNPTLWQRISKELMKPVGLVATLTEGAGEAIGAAAVGDFKGAGRSLVNVPGKLGGIITGTQTNSFTDVLQKNWKGAVGVNDDEGKSAGANFWNDGVPLLLGTMTDIAADPLNFLGGGLSKTGSAINKAEKLNKAQQAIDMTSKFGKELKALGLADDVKNLALAPTKAQQAAAGQRALLTVMANTRWEKTLVKGAPIYEATAKLGAGLKGTRAAQLVSKVFSTKTGDEGFNLVKNHFDNLLDYRKGKVMEEAIDIQRTVANLDQGEALRVLDVIESGTPSGVSSIDDVAKRLKDNFGAIKAKEEALGLLKTDIQDYFPHIKVKEQLPISKRLANMFGSAKKYSTALGSSKARKIEGSVSDINKMFGTEFFETRPAVAFAQRALGSAKAVTSAEFFNSAKQFGKALTDVAPEAANWIPVKGVKELDGFKFAPDVAGQIASYYKAVKPEELNVALRAFDSVQNWWKAQALVAPSYHLRNMAGNFWNNFLGNVVDPQVYYQAGKVQSGKVVNFVDDVGRNWDTPSIIEAAKKTGVINEGWFAKDIDTAIGSELGGNSWNPMKQNFGVYKANRAVGSVFENNARLAHFIQRLKEGSTIDDAALSVKKFLFDYGDLTDIEKGLFKRIFPFYTWTRKNIPLQLEGLLTQPGKAAVIPKVQNALEDRVEKPDEKYLGSYIRDNIGVRVGSDDKGNTYYFLLGSWLPAGQAINFLSQPSENFVASVSPFLKIPIEEWANKSTFFEDTFGQPSQIERFPHENQSWFGLTMRKKTAYILKNIRILNELDKLNPGGIFGDKDSPSLWNRIAPEAGVRVPKIGPIDVGLITTSDKQVGRYTPDTGGASRVLQSMFGKLIPYNPQLAKTFYMWDTDKKVRELQQAIKDAHRDGQDEYARRMREELKRVMKERRK